MTEREEALAAWLAERFVGFTVRGTQPPDVARVHRDVARMVVEWFDAQQPRGAVSALREIVRIDAEPRDSVTRENFTHSKRVKAMVSVATAALDRLGGQ